ncbi:MAG: 2-oxoacid:acceptor oxidoreductase family protein [bacterium]|jgi:2-oxoglutarate ferredoxin oxidoreductase subunit gamma
MKEITKIALAGEGGQGVQAVGEILAEAAYLAGKEAIYIPNFGVEQRGGVSIAFVQISNAQIGSPKFKQADIIVALSQRAVERTKIYLTPATLFIYDSSAIKPPEIGDLSIGIQSWDTVAPEAFANQVGTQPGKPITPPKVPKVIGIPAAQVAKDQLTPRVFNVIILGAIIAASQVLEPEIVKKAMEAKFKDKFAAKPELAELNEKAFTTGQELYRKHTATVKGGRA